MIEKSQAKPNDDIRLLCRARKIPMWMVADKFNISEQTFYRRLRHDLTEEDHDRIIAVIDELHGDAIKMA